MQQEYHSQRQQIIRGFGWFESYIKYGLKKRVRKTKQNEYNGGRLDIQQPIYLLLVLLYRGWSIILILLRENRIRMNYFCIWVLVQKLQIGFKWNPICCSLCCVQKELNIQWKSVKPWWFITVLFIHDTCVLLTLICFQVFKNLKS